MLLELLRVALGRCEVISRAPSEREWRMLHKDSVRQAVAGLCLMGIERLSANDPSLLANLPLDLKWEWIGLSEQIRQRYLHIDRQTAEIWNRLKDDGLDAAILKGQGIAQGYGTLAPYRQSGDIDIWVKGGYEKVCDYVRRTRPTDDVAYHRFHYDFFPDTEVELHHRPTLMRNLFDDRKLTRWYNSFDAGSFVYLEDKGFAVPSVEFNRIFILTHIYRHFLFEGIGLRQVLDYYFVLSGAKLTDQSERLKVTETLRSLRLMRFAEAMMWILHTQLGLEEQYLICGMAEKEGRFVLAEIEQTGNFGYGDSRYRYKYLFKLRRQMAHSLHLLIHYPSEVVWTPIWLIFHKAWKWNKIRKIKKSRR